MNNKGFTLVEILAVLIILSVLAVLSIGIINNNLSDSKNVIFDKQVVSIKEAAENWSYDHMEDIESNVCQFTQTTIGELINGGYLDEKFKNPITKKPFDSNLVVVVEKTNNSYDYIFELDDNYNSDNFDCN